MADSLGWQRVTSARVGLVFVLDKQPRDHATVEWLTEHQSEEVAKFEKSDEMTLVDWLSDYRVGRTKADAQKKAKATRERKERERIDGLLQAAEERRQRRREGI